jgi:methyl-accepting chemotaxis protein
MGKMVNDVTAAAQDVVSASRTATEAVSKAVKETNENITEGLEKLEESKHRAENIHNSMPKVNNMLSTSNLVQAAGGIKKIHNVKHQVAGRIMDSMNEFSDPVNYSILKGSDHKTKKHFIKSRGKSKRVRFQL